MLFFEWTLRCRLTPTFPSTPGQPPIHIPAVRKFKCTDAGARARASRNLTTAPPVPLFTESVRLNLILPGGFIRSSPSSRCNNLTTVYAVSVRANCGQPQLFPLTSRTPGARKVQAELGKREGWGPKNSRPTHLLGPKLHPPPSSPLTSRA